MMQICNEIERKINARFFGKAKCIKRSTSKDWIKNYNFARKAVWLLLVHNNPLRFFQSQLILTRKVAQVKFCWRRLRFLLTFLSLKWESERLNRWIHFQQYQFSYLLANYNRNVTSNGFRVFFFFRSRSIFVRSAVVILCKSARIQLKALLVLDLWIEGRWRRLSLSVTIEISSILRSLKSHDHLFGLPHTQKSVKMRQRSKFGFCRNPFIALLVQW